MKFFDSMSAEDIQELIMPYWQAFIDGALALLKGVFVLLVGWFIARMVRKLITKLFKKIKLDELSEKVKLDVFFDRIGIKEGISAFLGTAVYWIIMLFVIMGASRAAGLDMLAEKLESFLDFMPALFSSLVVFLFGMVLANKIKDLIRNVTESLGSAAGKVLSNLVYYFILILLTITSLDQLGIDTTLISNNVVLIIGISMLAGTLAYGLAAKDIMSNILSSFFGKKNFAVGQIVNVDGVRGEIIKMDNVTVTILNEEKEKVVLPSKMLMENKVFIIKDVERVEPEDENEE